MRKLYSMLTVLAIVMVALSAGCVDERSVTLDLSSGLQEPHNLRKMFEKDVDYAESSSSWGGGFFLFFGGVAGGNQSPAQLKMEANYKKTTK